MSKYSTIWKDGFTGLAFALIISASLWGLFEKKVLEWLFVHTSFYMLLTMVSVWSFLLIKYFKATGFSPKSFVVCNWRYFVSAALLTAIIFATTPVGFKTLNDEPVLLSVSQSLLYFRTPHEINEWLNFWGSYSPLSTNIPIRPLLFPFLLQLFHHIAGYHLYHAYILNMVLLFVFFSGVGVCFNKVSDRFTSYAAMLLCAAHPVIAIYGTGGGYDMMAAVFLFLTLVLLFGFIHDTKNERFALLWITLILLANIRHESCAYSLVIGLFSLTRLNKDGLKRHAWLLLSTGPLMMPYIWQRLLVTGRYENPAGTALFSFDMFCRNGHELLSNFLNIDFFLPYCGVLNGAAVVIGCVVMFNLMAGRLRVQPKIKIFCRILLACLVVNLVIILSHHAGRYSHATQARFFIIFSLATALTPIIYKLAYPQKLSSRALLCFSIIIMILYHPISMQNSFISSLMENRSYQACREFLKRNKYDHPLVITKWPVQITSMGYSAIGFDYANRHKEKILSDLRNRFFDGIIKFQQKTVEKNIPLKGQVLYWGREFEQIDKKAIYYNKVYLEISIIVDN
ncbi:hypothetical protein [Desulfosarcina widdelii]|uniref:hypothetical protein n=1 Tax=Desulfosarcina widdelii TaxID=947919 RepID=UPI0012D31922|nr:hypothetical protein [Desulfosarcina widdelii]